jgi:hypothetical protein
MCVCDRYLEDASSNGTFVRRAAAVGWEKSPVKNGRRRLTNGDQISLLNHGGTPLPAATAADAAGGSSVEERLNTATFMLITRIEGAGDAPSTMPLSADLPVYYVQTGYFGTHEAVTAIDQAPDVLETAAGRHQGHVAESFSMFWGERFSKTFRHRHSRHDRGFRM